MGDIGESPGRVSLVLTQPLRPPARDLQPAEEALRPGAGGPLVPGFIRQPRVAQSSPTVGTKPGSCVLAATQAWEPGSVLCWAVRQWSWCHPEGVGCPGPVTLHPAHLLPSPYLSLASSLLSSSFLFSLQSLLFPFLELDLVWNSGSPTAPTTDKQTMAGVGVGCRGTGQEGDCDAPHRAQSCPTGPRLPSTPNPCLSPGNTAPCHLARVGLTAVIPTHFLSLSEPLLSGRLLLTVKPTRAHPGSPWEQGSDPQTQGAAGGGLSGICPFNQLGSD